MDSMLEQRDHLKIRINILEDRPGAKPGSLADARKELAELEQGIAEHRRSSP
jgi:hypothetical protein